VSKIDLKKEFKHLYTAPADKPVLVRAPAMYYLMVDGEGDPNTSPQFSEAVEALYAVSYQLRAIIKEKLGNEYVVMPLEGLWWSGDKDAFNMGNRSEWRWSLMIVQPDVVTPVMLNDAIERVRRKKNLPALYKLKFDSISDGLCAQVMHVGPYTDEGPTVEKLHKFIFDSGYVLRGKHREIYLNDPRKTEPEKLKTIIRQPVQEAPMDYLL